MLGAGAGFGFMKIEFRREGEKEADPWGHHGEVGDRVWVLTRRYCRRLARYWTVWMRRFVLCRLNRPYG